MNTDQALLSLYGPIRGRIIQQLLSLQKISILKCTRKIHSKADKTYEKRLLNIEMNLYLYDPKITASVPCANDLSRLMKKTKQMACAPIEDSDQPGHPLSLIRVFAVRMKKAWVLSYPLRAQRRLIRLGRCPG